MGKSIIEVKNLTKVFGSQTVLDDISLDFQEGQITGLIGRNGSGKTVLLKCILGLTTPTKGTIHIAGKQVGKDMDFPEDIGFIINMPGFLPNYSGYMNLKFLADIRKRVGKKKICEAITMVGLDPTNRKKVGKYSLGMRQRLALAQAMMEDPDILILDEPMNSLDNAGVLEMRQIIAKLAERGKTIVLTSHNHEDIEMLCQSVYEMDHGKIFMRSAE
mgnify:CR=1 FL=1